jgi:hypothetical protein
VLAHEYVSMQVSGAVPQTAGIPVVTRRYSSGAAGDFAVYLPEDSVRRCRPASRAVASVTVRPWGRPGTGRRTEAALRITRRNGDNLSLAYAILGLALLARDAGDWDRAAVLHGAAQAFLALRGVTAELTTTQTDRRSKCPTTRESGSGV